MPHTDKILCRECREFEDTGMVYVQHCRYCDTIAESQSKDSHDRRREALANSSQTMAPRLVKGY